MPIERRVQLAVLGENQKNQGIKAVIDTGYTGFLTLPSSVITALELPWYMQQEGFWAMEVCVCLTCTRLWCSGMVRLDQLKSTRVRDRSIGWDGFTRRL
jgi:hypothetical protein